MSNILSNTTSLQNILEALHTKAAGGGEQVTPTITVNSSGLITATAGTKSATKQLTTQAAKTITPSKSSQTAVAKDVYTTGAITVAAIPSEYVILPQLTNEATAEDILAGKQLIGSDGSVITGTFSLDTEISTQSALLVEQDTKIAQLSNILSQKASNEGGGGVSVEGIPEGYAKVDYIQFTGEENLDTGIICNQDTKIIVRFTRDTSTAQYLYGVVNEGNTASVTAYLSSGGSWRFGAKSASRTVTVDANMIRTAIVTKTGIQGESGTASYSGVTSFETPRTLIIGGCRYSSDSAGKGFDGKLFGFEIWQGSTLVFKIVPVVNAEGMYRFWDSVSEEFLDSLTGVAFTGGNL